MQIKQGNAFETLRGAAVFLDQHASHLPEVIGTGAHRRLEAIIEGLSAHVTDQEANTLEARMATRTLEARRQSLLHGHMKPIVAIARLDLAKAPEGAAFRMPRAVLPVEQLAAAAHGMAAAARPHAALFIEAGLPDDFIEQLDLAADLLVQAKQTRTLCQATVRGATKGIGSALSDGRRVLAVLDSLVQRAAPADPALLTGWSAAAQLPQLAASPASRPLAFESRQSLGAPAALRLPRKSGQGDDGTQTPAIAQARTLLPRGES